MTETVRYSSFENVLADITDLAESGSLDVSDLETVETSSEFHLTPDMIGSILEDPSEADLQSIVNEINILADELSVPATNLFFKILELAIAVDEKKNSNARADGMID